MNPDQIKASYRRALNETGGLITVRRYTGTGPTRAKFDVDVMARVVGYSPKELIGTIQQGDRKIILLADDLSEAGFVPPFKPATDKIVIRDKEMAIVAPDDSTRRVGAVLFAYELQVRG